MTGREVRFYIYYADNMENPSPVLTGDIGIMAKSLDNEVTVAVRV